MSSGRFRFSDCVGGSHVVLVLFSWIDHSINFEFQVGFKSENIS